MSGSWYITNRQVSQLTLKLDKMLA